jgi:hypothetical protein
MALSKDIRRSKMVGAEYICNDGRNAFVLLSTNSAILEHWSKRSLNYVKISTI